MGTAAALLAQEITHELRHFVRLFEMRQVTSVVNQLDARIGDPVRELFSVGGRNHVVRRPQTTSVGTTMR